MAYTFSIGDIGQDIIDSRELQELYDDLISEQEDLEQAIKDARVDLKQAQADYDVDEALEALDEAEQELEHFNVENSGIMREIEDAMEEIGEWQYGEVLIHENYWIDYVEDMLNDLGYLNTKDAWFIEIDWEKTARNVAMDYITVELDGHTYYARNS